MKKTVKKTVKKKASKLASAEVNNKRLVPTGLVAEGLKPTFLRGVKVTKARQAELAEYSSNWVRLNQHLQGLGHEISVGLLAELMVTELSTRRRKQVLSRLKSRYDGLRREAELVDLGLKD